MFNRAGPAAGGSVDPRGRSNCVCQFVEVGPGHLVQSFTAPLVFEVIKMSAIGASGAGSEGCPDWRASANVGTGEVGATRSAGDKPI